MRNRIFAVLLAVVMVLAVLPMAVFAADTATVYIAGTAYTSASTDALPSGVTIDWDSNTITLNGANIEYTISQSNDYHVESAEGFSINYSYCIFINDTQDWTLELTGNNYIKHNNSVEPANTQNAITAVAGISAAGGLIITGNNAALNVSVTDLANITSVSAIFAKNIEIKECKVSTTLSSSTTKMNLWGAIYATNTLGIENAEVSVDISGKTQFGVYAQSDLSITGNDTAIAVNAKKADTDFTTAINSDGNSLTINAGSIDIDAPKGIHGNVSITDSATVDIDATETGISGREISISSDDVDVCVTGDDAAAIVVYGSATISNGNYSGDIAVASASNTAENSITISDKATVAGNITVGKNDAVIISGGTITGNVTTGEASSVTMSGGTVSGSLSTGTDDGSSLTVTGGTVEGAVTTNADNANIIAGTFKDSSVDQYLSDEVQRDENGNIGVTVTVTFNPNNGDTVFTQPVFVSNNIPEPTAPVRTGYNFIGWSADGVTTVTFPYTVTADTTLTALWEEVKQNNNDYWMAMMLYMMMNQKFDITATVTEGGTITDAGVTQVKYNKDVTYTIIPAEGYEIADVIVDGKSVGAVSEYTFDNVRKAHTIEAVFVKTAWVNPFADVHESDWFYEDIAFVTENGIMNGVIENDTFAPEEAATRAILVTTLWRMEGEPVVETPVDFLDVPADEWYSEAVNWASANGIVLGYEGLFNPENALTREQVAAILHRYAAYKGMDDGIALPMLPQYECSVWAENDVNWADANSLFDGIGSDMRDLTEDATRAEVAAMLRRMCERFIITE